MTVVTNVFIHKQPMATCFIQVVGVEVNKVYANSFSSSYFWGYGKKKFYLFMVENTLLPAAQCENTIAKNRN